MSDQESLTDQTSQPVDQTEPTGETPTRRSRPKSFNEKIGEAELLAEAMDKNKEELAVRGGGDEFVNQLKAVLQETKDLNEDQERNKAELKDSTLKVKLKMKELDMLARDGRKIVKMVINQERWVEFGINVTK